MDTVVLGCTHYPLVAPMLQRTLGRDVRLVTAGPRDRRHRAAGAGRAPASPRATRRRATTASSAPATPSASASSAPGSCRCRWGRSSGPTCRERPGRRQHRLVALGRPDRRARPLRGRGRRAARRRAPRGRASAGRFHPRLRRDGGAAGSRPAGVARAARAAALRRRLSGAADRRRPGLPARCRPARRRGGPRVRPAGPDARRDPRDAACCLAGARGVAAARAARRRLRGERRPRPLARL